MTKEKYCAECKHAFVKNSEWFCLRLAKKDLVTGRIKSGDHFLCFLERYPDSYYYERMLSVCSEYTGPCDKDGRYYESKVHTT